MFLRRSSRQILVGGVRIGNGAPVVVQSMNNTKTHDIQATLCQIDELAKAGCEITRLAVPDLAAAEALKVIVKKSPLPIVADIHFDHTLALRAIEAGVSALRINPGNMRSVEGVAEVARRARRRCLPIRIGANSGSLPQNLIDKHGGVNAASMVDTVLGAVHQLEALDFFDLCLSIKASDPMLTIEAYRLLANQTDYPLHLGVTEAGTLNEGTIRSAVGIGTLLAEGIGDTIRVSLTADPVLEVNAAYSILKALRLRSRGAELISCPTCGRTSVGLVKMAERVEAAIADVTCPIKVAIMGCIVNGPGEAREADVGLAGGDGSYLVFCKNKSPRKVSEKDAFAALMAEIDEFTKALEA